MPTWGTILHELTVMQLAEQALQQQPDPTQASPFDRVRRKYLKRLTEHTERPVVVYASGWLEGRPWSDPESVIVSNRDVMGFMEALNGVTKGPLDLILHSPGGSPDAAQAIMSYLRDQGYGPIRAIVPLAAMSAATMMALSCDEILMGTHSQIGPIDPQLTISTPEGPRSSPAQAILDQFEQAKSECASSPAALAAWLPILRSYAPGLLSQCLTAQSASQDLVATAMRSYMFSDLPDSDATAQAARIAEWFNDHKSHRSHGRPVRLPELRELGVKVRALEADDDLQDAVLSAWHGVQLTLAQVAVAKLVESSEGGTWLISGPPGAGLQIQLVQQPEASPPPPPSPPAPNREERRRQERASRKPK